MTPTGTVSRMSDTPDPVPDPDQPELPDDD